MYLNVYLIVNIWIINCESPRRSLSFFIPSLLQPAGVRGRSRGFRPPVITPAAASTSGPVSAIRRVYNRPSTSSTFIAYEIPT